MRHLHRQLALRRHPDLLRRCYYTRTSNYQQQVWEEKSYTKCPRLITTTATNKAQVLQQRIASPHHTCLTNQNPPGHRPRLNPRPAPRTRIRPLQARRREIRSRVQTLRPPARTHPSARETRPRKRHRQYLRVARGQLSKGHGGVRTECLPCYVISG